MGGWGGGPTHYVVNPTRVEVELRLSWAVTTLKTAYQDRLQKESASEGVRVKY